MPGADAAVVARLRVHLPANAVLEATFDPPSFDPPSFDPLSFDPQSFDRRSFDPQSVLDPGKVLR